MGLDMYLNAKRFLWSNQEELTMRIAIGAVLGLPEKYQREANTIEIQAAYWRKDNHIHKWFVDKVQGGDDECNESDVSREQLEELIKLCQRVSADHSLAQELLPTQAGFFFGSTDYDEYYFASLDSTITKMTEALTTFDNNYDFTYRASW